MNNKQFIVGLLLFCWTTSVLAYLENYPPYKFKDGPFKHLDAELLVDYAHREYRSKDGQVRIKVKNVSDLLLQVGKTVLVNNGEDSPMPYGVYRVDLDKNGFKDFIVFYQVGASSLGGGQADLFLNKDGKSYERITYDTICGGLEDFVDLNNDGRYEVIITGVYAGDKHNYMTYNIYELNGYRLVNANSKFKGFPKIVWLTNKPNDKDTLHLSKEERAKSVREADSSIKYREIK